MLTMPVDAILHLSEKQVSVFTDGMGRCPGEIEDQVMSPLSVSQEPLDGDRVPEAPAQGLHSDVLPLSEECRKMAA